MSETVRALPGDLTEEGRQKLAEIAVLDAVLAPILSRAREGSREAFDELWGNQHLQNAIRRTIRATMWERNDADAEDIESIVSLNLWTSLRTYDPGKSPFVSWARAIARRHTQRYVTKKPRETALPPDFVSGEVHSEIPPSACFDELLRYAQTKPPHEALAFLFNRYLGWEPERIEREIGDQAMRTACERLIAEVTVAYPVLRRLKDLLAPLLTRTQREARMSDFYGGQSPPDAISHWSGGIARFLRSRVHSQGKKFLKLACELPAEAHKKISFLWSRLLRRMIDGLSLQAERQLLEILRVFHEEFPKLAILAADEVLRGTRPLQKQIIPGKTLGACAPTNLREELCTWRNQVQRMLLGPARDQNLLAYAYLCGAFPLVRRSRRGASR